MRRVTRRKAVSALAVLGGCGGREGSPVRIVAVGLQEFFPLFLAQELGHFRDAGVEVVTEVIAGGSKGVEALMAGSSDVMYDGYDYTLFRAPEGRRLRAFVITTLTPVRLLAVAPGQADRIRRVEDLKGATVGVGSFGGAHQRALERFLHLHGLKVSDVRLAVAGAGAPAVAAFEYGKVDAGILTWSAYNVLKRRAPRTRVLIDPRSSEEKRRVFGVEDLPSHSLFAREDWLAGHPAQARALAQGMLRTLRWIREHPVEEVRARMPERLRTAYPEADMETLRAVADALSADGTMPPGGPEAVAKAFTPAVDREREPNFDLSKTYTGEFVKPAQ